jgi:hypothetical protein
MTEHTYPPFFIIGNDRSGTTMLRLILDRGQEAAIPTESMFVGDFARAREGKDFSDHESAVRLTRSVWEHPKVRLWDLPGPAPEPPLGLDHASAYRVALEAPYRAYATREGKSRWGDKTPYYLAFVDRIVDVWPEARFLEVVRDGRDVALSVIPLPFGANNVWAAARVWAAGIRLGQGARRRYPGQVLTVRYEDLVSAPEEHVRRICDFLAMTYRDEMLHIEETPKDKIVGDQREWFSKIWQGINQTSVGKWRTKMSRDDQRLFVAVAGRELELHGYEVDVPGAPPSARRELLLRTQNAGARAVNFVRLRLIQEHGRELSYVMKRKLRQT